VVRRLHVASGGSEITAEEEYAIMRDNIRAELLTRSSRISDLWSTRPMLRRLLVACGVQLFGQFTGINVLNYFGPQLYSALGFAHNKLLLIQGIYGAVGPITNFFFITFILDSVGRKKPLLFGAGSLVVLFSILSALLASFPPTTVINPAAQRAGVAVIFMMSIVFSLSFGPVSWVLASEVFPTRSRSLGTAAATCSNWGINVLISQVSPIALANIGWRYVTFYVNSIFKVSLTTRDSRYDILFIALNAIDFLIILLFFPETKGNQTRLHCVAVLNLNLGKTLEDMADVFGDKIDAVTVLKHHGDTVVQECTAESSEKGNRDSTEKV
jgi:hypothetical protein